MTLMDVFEGALEILSTAGESFLGGEDFTDRLVASVLQKNGMQLESAELREPLRVARLRQQCEAAKRQLASDQTVTVRLPDAAGNLAADAPVESISRADYNTLVGSLIERLKLPVAKALRDGRAEPADVADVILVGGATRSSALSS